MSDTIKAYQKNDTLGKSPVELVIKVYSGAIAAFEQAKTAVTENNNDLFQTQLEKARKFITHLYTTLDMEKGGEIAAQLSQLYSFMINQINIAEATKDLQIIDDNITVLKNLQEGWQELAEQPSTVAADSNQPVPETAGLSVSG